MSGKKTDAEKWKAQAEKWQSKAAVQRSEIGRITKALEVVESSKRDHVFRLRMLLGKALDGEPGWQDAARREIGRRR